MTRPSDQTSMSAAEYRAANSNTRRENKFRARKAEAHGITFDSKAEANRYCDLVNLEKANAICDLERQPKYPITINGVHICNVILDSRYFDRIEGRERIEDVKGKDNALSRPKRKMVEAQHGITVEVVS